MGKQWAPTIEGSKRYWKLVICPKCSGDERRSLTVKEGSGDLSTYSDHKGETKTAWIQ